MLAISDITQHINALHAQVPLHTIENEHEYDEAINALNELLDAGNSFLPNTVYPFLKATLRPHPKKRVKQPYKLVAMFG